MSALCESNMKRYVSAVNTMFNNYTYYLVLISSVSVRYAEKYLLREHKTYVEDRVSYRIFF